MDMCDYVYVLSRLLGTCLLFRMMNTNVDEWLSEFCMELGSNLQLNKPHKV